MNRYLMKHIHSNLYLAVLGIYTDEEADTRRPNMKGIVPALDAFQYKQLNFPIYLQPRYDQMSELREGKSSVPATTAMPAGMVLNATRHLTTVTDFGCSAVVVVGLVRLFEPLLAKVDSESWGFSVRGLSKLFYSDHYLSPTKTMMSVTGWDAFEYVRDYRENLLLDRLYGSTLKDTIEKAYAYLSQTEKQREAVMKALSSVESVTDVDDVSYMRDGKMIYTFRFRMDLQKAFLLYRVFPSYLQLRVAHAEQSTMVCFFDVGDEDDLRKLPWISLSSFLNKPTGL